MSDEKPLYPVDVGVVEAMPTHFDDLDHMGIVHNTRYPVFVERALTMFWTRQGFSFSNGVYSQPDVFLAVVDLALSYRAPIRGTNTIGVHFWVDRLGRTSATYGFRVTDEGGTTVHAEGTRSHVRLDDATLQPTAWTPAAVSVLERLSAPSA